MLIKFSFIKSSEQPRDHIYDKIRECLIKIKTEEVKFGDDFISFSNKRSFAFDSNLQGFDKARYGKFEFDESLEILRIKLIVGIDITADSILIPVLLLIGYHLTPLYYFIATLFFIQLLVRILMVRDCYRKILYNVID
jgi:hypothetical protein